MMSELKNEFSWSKTRDEVFKTCPRQYWFAYYGYWNGWVEYGGAFYHGREEGIVRAKDEVLKK